MKRLDLSGQRFGTLTVLNFDKIKGTASYWICKCDCGTIKSIRGSSLSRGYTTTCGNQKNHPRLRKHQELIGQIFGYLTVLQEIKREHGQGYYLCRCKCGTEKIIREDSLKQGKTVSCGCISSKGEQKIINLLQNHNIQFVKEFTFTNCILPSGRRAKFDFYINNSYLIEYDGIQHFYESFQGYKNPHDNLSCVKERDQFKNQWCKDNRHSSNKNSLYSI